MDLGKALAKRSNSAASQALGKSLSFRGSFKGSLRVPLKGSIRVYRI